MAGSILASGATEPATRLPIATRSLLRRTAYLYVWLFPPVFMTNYLCLNVCSWKGSALERPSCGDYLSQLGYESSVREKCERSPLFILLFLSLNDLAQDIGCYGGAGSWPPMVLHMWFFGWKMTKDSDSKSMLSSPLRVVMFVKCHVSSMPGACNDVLTHSALQVGWHS